MGDFSEPPDIIERQTLCFSQPQPGMVVQQGQHGFKDGLLRLYSAVESNAAEKLVILKDNLRNANSESFWPLLTEGLASISGAQYAFVSKRILVDDENVAVEMPPIGEPGACLMGAAFYINDGHGTKQHLRNFKYHAYSCPCAYMRHDKIFIIPEKLNDFIINNPNPLVVPGEAYLGIPLFADGKCFAHFGVMWSEEGAARRNLGWGYLELLLHSLEDLILSRVLQANDFAASVPSIATPAPIQETPPRVIPHQDVYVGQSLKPYARSLSHELRTPMQGVVGMLDVMMANVKEASEGQNDPHMAKILETLRENIETVQDSSRRAVEAADNVVHAYDMNMGVPEAPQSPLDNIAEDSENAEDNAFLRRPDILVTGNSISINQFRGTKRRRDDFSWRTAHTSTAQTRVSRATRRRVRNSISEGPPVPRSGSSVLAKATQDIDISNKTLFRGAVHQCDGDPSSSPIFASEQSVVPGLRHTDLREVIRYLINDSLKLGGRPDSAIAEETEFGERIEVRTRSSNGQANTKYISWMVTPDVPDTILIDEKDLAKTVSCVISNAIKFTDNGDITLRATLSANDRYIVINVKDTGSGIPQDFVPYLFKPFSQGDNSTTRESEGLGLGLMVARHLARKLGGDLSFKDSKLTGPRKGSEFEIRVPLFPGEVCSRSASPFGSPTPPIKPRRSANDEMAPHPGPLQPITPPLPSVPYINDSNPSILSCSGTSATLKVSPSLSHLGLPSPRSVSPSSRRAASKNRALSENQYDRNLAEKYPLNVLVVEDNKINRKLCVHMLAKLGYTNVLEAYDGNNAVEQMRKRRPPQDQIDVVLMDLWMPFLDGFQATEAIVQMRLPKEPTILAVSADITAIAIARADKVGMKGFLTKPFQIRDLEKLIVEHSAAIAQRRWR